MALKCSLKSTWCSLKSTAAGPSLPSWACQPPSKAPDSSAHSQVISCLCAQALARLGDQNLSSAVPPSLCWCPRTLFPSPSCGSPTADTENHSSLPSVINRYLGLKQQRDGFSFAGCLVRRVLTCTGGPLPCTRLWASRAGGNPTGAPLPILPPGRSQQVTPTEVPTHI